MAGAEFGYNETEDDVPEEPFAEQSRPPAERLAELIQTPNIAALLDDDDLKEISTKALDGYKLDKSSREDWEGRVEGAMDLAMLLAEEKDYPFNGAANVKYPLLTTAALQFNARAYPAIVQGNVVAKCKVNGHDPDGAKAARGDRVSEHLSWQLTSEMPEWEEDTDRLLMILPIVGCVFRKTYFDPTIDRKCSRLVTANRLVINYRSRSLQDVPRISEELTLYPYEIEERIRDGRFIEFKYGEAKPDEKDESGRIDEDGPHKFIEQHRLLDLDEDGYAEPYIVTIHVESEHVCRIVANYSMETVRVTQDGKVAAIRKQEYYTKYLFMPSPDGGAYGMGLGQLLFSTNEAINTTLNEMLDAGHLSNLQGGFISANAGIREKSITLERGKFKVLNTALPMQQAVMQMKYDGPSAVLFNLLGLLIDQGKEVSSTKDVLMGDTASTATATTTLALIEQGMKVFNAIFKRVHRSVKHELDLHCRLNKEHLSPEAYNAFWDAPAPAQMPGMAPQAAPQQFDPKADYDMSGMDVTPVSDPTISTEMQRLAQASIIREIAANNPMVNQEEATRRSFEAARVPDVDKLMIKPPQPDPKELAFAEAMKSMTLLELKTKIEKLETAALLDIANAEAAEEGSQISFYDQYLKSLQAEHAMEQSSAQQAAGGQGQLSGMAGAPGNEMGAGAAPGAGGGGQGVSAGPAIQPIVGPAGPMAGEPSPVSASPGAM